MSAGDFRQLIVWQKAWDVAVRVYRISSIGELARDYGFRDQLGRASVSICSNIAEGNDRRTDRDTTRFLYLAKGSAAELLSHIEIAMSIGYLDSERSAELRSSVEEISRMLRGLVTARTSE